MKLALLQHLGMFRSQSVPAFFFLLLGFHIYVLVDAILYGKL